MQTSRQKRIMWAFAKISLLCAVLLCACDMTGAVLACAQCGALNCTLVPFTYDDPCYEGPHTQVQALKNTVILKTRSSINDFNSFARILERRTPL